MCWKTFDQYAWDGGFTSRHCLKPEPSYLAYLSVCAWVYVTMYSLSHTCQYSTGAYKGRWSKATELHILSALVKYVKYSFLKRTENAKQC